MKKGITHFKHIPGGDSQAVSGCAIRPNGGFPSLQGFKNIRMKPKTALLILLSLFFGYIPVSAQKNNSGENIQEKVSQVVEALDEAFKLEKSAKNNLTEIFTDFYGDQQKLRNNIQRPASGLAQGLSSQDFQSVRKRNEALIAERDSRLKKELSEEHYKKWKAVIEPSLHKKKKK